MVDLKSIIFVSVTLNIGTLCSTEAFKINIADVINKISIVNLVKIQISVSMLCLDLI